MVIQSIERTENPIETQLERLVPGIHSEFAMVVSNNNVQHVKNQDAIACCKEEVITILQSNNSHILNLAQQVHSLATRSMEATTITTFRFPTAPEGGSAPQPQTELLPPQTAPLIATAAPSTEAGAASSAVAGQVQLAGSCPPYQFYRGATTISKVWDEWKNGLNGLSPVRTMEQSGKSYRQKDNKYFNRSRGSIFTCLDFITTTFGRK